MGTPPASESPLLEVGEAVAVIDIGSNSARIVAYGKDAAGHLRMLASTRAALRLVSDVDAHKSLGTEAMDRALTALEDFRAIALGAGAARILAVATAAMRDAADGAALLERIRGELGIEVRLIDGDEEARYGFAGGIRGLPVEHGLLFDMGGGSLQLSRFRERRLVQAWSLPLGALRLSRAFLTSDPPRPREIRALQEHVRELVEAAGIPRLEEGETLVGTGGTVRNLAKIDRRRHVYPIARVHGYVLRRGHLRRLAARLAARRQQKRGRVPGLSGERADSIAGGGVALATLVDLVDAREILVSGMGVREGMAYGLSAEELPAPAAVREASIASLCSRFWGFRAEAAERRATLAAALLERLAPDASADLRDALRAAARLLDIGRSVDFFDRHHHVADIVLETEMNGFSHHQIALISAVVRAAGDEDTDPARYAPLLGEDDWDAVERAALILALADDIEERCPRETSIDLDCRIRGRHVVLTVAPLAGWRARALGPRFERVFGRTLTVKPAPGTLESR
jgi:exopolyphosphatase/guanosine-5'-triphosphate,3'-diphosphate pyrophosphatase